MKICSIQSNNYQNSNSPKFGALNVTECGQKLLNSFYGSAEILPRIDMWKKELANTKHFDLEISELCNDLFMILNNKNNCRLNSEAPIRVYKEAEGRRLDVFGTDLIDPGDWVYYPLEFASKADAETAYHTLNRFQTGSSLYTSQRIEWAVDSAKILDKAYEYMKNPKVVNEQKLNVEASEVKNTKLPFLKRLQNAWFALIGE